MLSLLVWVSHTSFTSLDSASIRLDGKHLQVSPPMLCVVLVWTLIGRLKHSQRFVHLSWRHSSVDLNPPVLCTLALASSFILLSSEQPPRQTTESLFSCSQSPLNPVSKLQTVYLLSIHSTTKAWLMQFYWDVCPPARFFNNSHFISVWLSSQL